ncbi:uncharacterized protein LOC133465451 isoform X2 [Phyllopteryx taeniolatus]|uniref:uncharacterized protein LOC133465451 isoform X2 n=1 Tax=Phyllopteryx taeniolatus TaxID=161469 RepID=UPI002AD59EA6|nr:uncharacterized protein LOC133465451 isoform X2 [Phyllopteryx taeniolatus]
MNRIATLAALLAFSVCVSGDSDCEKWNFSPTFQTEDGFQLAMPFARGFIHVSQNERNIATVNFTATPWKFTLSEEVLQMDNVSIVLKHFKDTEIRARYRDGVIVELCVLYKTSGESVTKNITRDPDKNRRYELAAQIDCEKWNFSPTFQTEDGFQLAMPFARGFIHVSQNERNIATVNFTATPWKFTLSEEVLQMDNVSIVLKHFKDTEIRARYRDGVIVELCVLYKTSGESVTKNITRDPDKNRRYELAAQIGGVICGALFVVLSVISAACYWRGIKSRNARNGSSPGVDEVELQEKLPMAAGQDLV